MAVIAGDSEMRTLEREVCLEIVIEIPKVPGDGIVAPVATPGETAAVWVVLVMTTCTVGFYFLECLGFVAVLAFVVIVLPQQRKRSQVMIKKHRILPIHLGVACFANCPEGAIVRVVIKVTGIAARIQLNFKNRFHMAVIACDFFMPTEQRIVGINVVLKRRIRPGAKAVAGIALLAVVPVMIVVFQVA